MPSLPGRSLSVRAGKSQVSAQKEGANPSTTLRAGAGAPRPPGRTLVPSRCQHKIKARGVGEGAKVTVPRKQGNASIPTTLGD